MPRNKDQTEQIRAESREKILSTALKLFSERGYDGCNVSDIAREAGMSQGNIYWYFPSKKEIFKAVLVQGFAGLGSIMADAAAQSGAALEKLDFFLSRFLALVKQESGDQFVSLVVTFIAQGGVQRFSEFGLSTYEIGAGYHRSLDVIFEQGLKEGIIHLNLEPSLLSTFFFSFVNGLMLMYPDEWKTIPDEVIRQAVLRLLGINAG